MINNFVVAVKNVVCVFTTAFIMLASITFSYCSTPEIAVSSVVFNSNIVRITYNPYDIDGDSVAVTECQYSLDNVTWVDISSTAILNNTAKVTGQQTYIDWVTTATFTSSLTDSSVWFRMKACNGGYGNFVVSPVTIPVGPAGHGTVVDSTNGYLYILGGDIGPSEATDEIYYTKIGNTDEIDTFTSSQVKLPVNLRVHGHQAIGYDGYLYVICGNLGGACTNVINYAKMNSSGTLNSFVSSTNTLPVELNAVGCTISNGYLYAIGGYTYNSGAVNTVYYAKISTDNHSVGTIITSTNTLPVSLGFNDVVVHNGYIYSIGGGSHVYYAKLNPDGSMDSFATVSSSLPYVFTYVTVIVDEEYLYIVGGVLNSTYYTDKIYYAKFNTDGSLSEFKLSDKTLPTGLAAHGVETFNNRFYVTAGCTAYKAYTNKVRYCSLPNLSTGYFVSPLFAINVDTSNPTNTVPELMINSVTLSSETVRINYTAYDFNGDNIITSDWQYSKDGINWLDIVSPAILNNSYKPSGVSYIDWVTTQTIKYAGNQSMYFRMKAMDYNSLGYASSFSTLTYTLPAGLVHHGFSKYNDTVYLMGGVTNSTPSESESSVYSNKIYTAKLNPDGTFKSGFSLSTATLPTARYSLKTGAYNGYLYVIGGGSNTSRLIDDVCYLEIGNDGILSSVNVSTNTAPTIHAGGFASCIYNNYLYFTGGYNTPSSTMYDTVYYAKIKASGDISSFALSPVKMTVKLFEHSALVNNGYLYIIGGHLGNAQDSNKIYYAKINTDGSIGSFVTNVNTLPVNISMLSCFVSNGYLYITGGHNYSTCYNRVYYGKIQSDGSIGTITLSSESVIPKAAASHHTLTTDNGFYVIGGMNSRGYSRNNFSDTSNNIYYSKFTFMSSTYSVSPVFILNIADNTPPEKVEYVNDGLGADVNVWYSTTALSANWTKTDDSESCVKKYWYAVGTSSGGVDVVTWTDIGLSTYVVRTGLSLTNGTTYYVSVKAENYAGLTGNVASSDGMRVIDVSVDTTIPSMPQYVWDGTGYDVDVTLSTTTLSANYGVSLDNETGITAYFYSIGTTKGGTEIVDWVNILYATFTVRTGLSLSPETTYYFNLKALNNAGLYSAVRTSDGIRVVIQTSTQTVIDLTPPDSPGITSTTHPINDTAYANTLARFAFMSSTQDVSGIAGYYYLVNGSSYTMVTPENGTYVTWSTITMATLADGIWYIHAIAVDNAGNWSAKNTAHYKFIVHLTIDPSQDVALVYSDGLKIDIPAGTLTNSTKVEVNKPSVVNQPRVTNDPKLKDTDIVVEIKLADGTHELGKDITITIPYTDAILNGINEDNLRVFYYNEVNKGWVLIPVSSVDKVNKQISVQVNHLTMFKVMEYITASESIETLSNYPNPFKPEKPYTMIHYVLKTDADVVIKIFDLTGELVWERKVGKGESNGGVAGPNDVVWDGKNGMGLTVDKGAYICVVQCDGVTLKTKLGVK